MLIRTGNRLLVSPWFAAGAGFVIAMGALIYMPHANVDFGGAIHVTHCKLAKCPQLTPQGGVPGLPAGVAGGQVTASPSTPSLPAGVTFWYQPLNQPTQSGFGMWIAIRAPLSITRWQLSFVIQGTEGIYVFWPRWKPAGTDGATVSSILAGTESADYAMISGHQDGSFGGASQTGDIALFQVRGTGVPNRPIDCTFDGVACQFKLANDLVPTASAGPG